MLNDIFRKSEKDEHLDEQINSVLSALDQVGPRDEEYDKLMERLERLMKLRHGDKPERISRNTLLIVAGNLALGFGLFWFERTNVLNTKLFPTPFRPKSKDLT